MVCNPRPFQQLLANRSQTRRQTQDGLYSAIGAVQVHDTANGAGQRRSYMPTRDAASITGTAWPALPGVPGRCNRIRGNAGRAALQPKKCVFLQDSLPFLGHIVSAEGLGTDPEKVRAVTEWPTPTSGEETRSFLGLAGYYRAFIPSYNRIALPLTRLTEKAHEFRWTNECEPIPQPIPSGYPNQPLGVDIVGPFPPSKHGNVYLLAMEGFFSKWAEAAPIPNQEARTVADAIINHGVSRFGVPDSIHSDQGSNFKSRFVYEVCGRP